MIALLLFAAAANLPELPKDVPSGATLYSMQLLGIEAGQLAAWTEPDGKLRVFFQFNDRGRGPKTYETIALDAQGLPASLTVEGNDYMKDPVHESFAVQDGVASWKNKAEHGEQRNASGFYVSMFGSPLDAALLASAALKAGGSIPLLPSGEARVRKVAQLPEATLYALTGLDFAPLWLWLDAQGRLFASWSQWSVLILRGSEGVVPRLKEAQTRAMEDLERDRAQRLAHRPAGKLLIHDAGVFDSERARIEPHRDVLIEANRIISVLPTGKPPAGAQVIDASGKTLIPGLWDMHAHVADNDGLLNLAAGVTAVRDLANDNDELFARMQRIEKGEEIGTRIVRAGFMDGPGPYQGPTKVLVATPEEALKWVDWYADHGFVQIKMYSSIKPELVPLVAEEAHKRGLRVSGHIPAFMTAAQAVQQGYDEIQHVNMLLLNFMPDVKDTRTPARFLEPAKRAGDLDLGSPQVRAFEELLLDRHTTLDLTLSVFESMFLDRPGTLSVGLAPVANRLPPQVRRGLYAGNLPVPEGMDAKYRASWKKTLQFVHQLWAAGVPVLAGTDALAGFSLQRELELDVEAGIPPAKVLQLATLNAARVAGVDRDLGVIRPGKLADVALIDGNPAAEISQIRKVALTIRDGVLYQPAELDRELGIAPQ